MFSLSEESRVLKPGQGEWDGERRVQWPPVDSETGLRKLLTPDREMIAAMKTAIDPVTCIVRCVCSTASEELADLERYQGLAYPLILLAKICNSGLARCELTTTDKPAHPNDPSADTPYACAPPSPLPGRAILVGRKLSTLLALGASFLDSIAPTPSHPAAIHAQTIRTLLRAGTWGQDVTRGNHGAQKELFRAVSSGQPESDDTSAMDSAGVQSAQVRKAGKILEAVLAQISPTNSPPPSSMPGPPLGPSAPRQQQLQMPPQDSLSPCESSGPPATAASTSTTLFGFQQHAQSQFSQTSDLPFFPPPFPNTADDFGSTFPSVSPSAGHDAGQPVSISLQPQSTSQSAFTFDDGAFSFPASAPFSPLGLSATIDSSLGFYSTVLSHPATGFSADTSMAIDLDTDSLLARAGEIDWSAIERQLGMKDGALSAGVAVGAGDLNTGGAPLGLSGTGEGSTDWMSL